MYSLTIIYTNSPIQVKKQNIISPLLCTSPPEITTIFTYVNHFLAFLYNCYYILCITKQWNFGFICILILHRIMMWEFLCHDSFINLMIMTLSMMLSVIVTCSFTLLFQYSNSFSIVLGPIRKHFFSVYSWKCWVSYIIKW